MNNIKETIARNIKLFRENKGFSQKELAEKIGVKHNAVSSWEAGINSVKIEVLMDMCDILGVSLNQMYGKESSPTPAAQCSPLQSKINRLDEIDTAKTEGFVDGLLSQDKYVREEITAYSQADFDDAATEALRQIGYLDFKKVGRKA